jgi:hypothetical protein
MTHPDYVLTPDFTREVREALGISEVALEVAELRSMIDAMLADGPPLGYSPTNPTEIFSAEWWTDYFEKGDDGE